MTRRRLVPALVVAVLATGVSASDVRGQQREVFRTSVDLVQLDVTAADQDGRPVLDLSADDLEVFEDGQPVELVSFRAVRLPDRPAQRPAIRAAVVPGVMSATNDQSPEGRIIVIVLDQVPRERFHRVKQTVLALLDHLGPGDQVAMVANGGTAAYQVEFTRDLSRVARALDVLTFFTGNGRELLRMLTRFADALRPISGRRKIVALVSDGVPEISASLAIGGDSRNRIPEFRDFLAAAAQANVTVYAFSPRYAFDVDQLIHAETVKERADQIQSEQDGIFGLQTVAEATGGRATVRTNTFEPDVARMFAESASYYLVAYRSNNPPDGKFHDVELRCRRPGVSVRTRSGYRLPKQPAKDAPVIRPVDRLAAAPIQTEGLPLRLVAVALPNGSKRTSSVHIVTEVNGAQLAGAEGLELKALGVDMGGEVRATDRFEGRLLGPLSPEGDRWLRVALSLELRPGRYQLRVAGARSDEGAAGSVFDEIEVPDFREDLAVGGLVVGTPESSGVAGAERLLEDLGFVPMATTEWPEGMAVRAGLPIRVAPEYRAASVGLVAALSGSDDVAREVVREERPAAAFVDGGTFTFALPQGLAPGDYHLRLDVTLDQRSASREVAFRLLSGTTPPEPAAGPRAGAGRVPRYADPELQALMDATAGYLDDYLDRFTSVVAEETYEQFLTRQRSVINRTTRRLRSDFLLVQLPGRGLVPFRDVFEVNGKPVRDRDDRLRKLFLEMPEGALDTAQRVLGEGARYNLGGVVRNVNQPMLALKFLALEHLGALDLSLEGEEVVGDVRARRVEFKETGAPTIVTDLEGKNRPSSGSFWIESGTGRIVKATIRNTVGFYSTETTVVFRPFDETGLLAPAEMREAYTSAGERIHGTATYTNFRRFEVRTGVEIKK